MVTTTVAITQMRTTVQRGTAERATSTVDLKAQENFVCLGNMSAMVTTTVAMGWMKSTAKGYYFGPFFCLIFLNILIYRRTLSAPMPSLVEKVPSEFAPVCCTSVMEMTTVEMALMKQTASLQNEDHDYNETI